MKILQHHTKSISPWLHLHPTLKHKQLCTHICLTSDHARPCRTSYICSCFYGNSWLTQQELLNPHAFFNSYLHKQKEKNKYSWTRFGTADSQSQQSDWEPCFQPRGAHRLCVEKLQGDTFSESKVMPGTRKMTTNVFTEASFVTLGEQLSDWSLVRLDEQNILYLMNSLVL